MLSPRVRSLVTVLALALAPGCFGETNPAEDVSPNGCDGRDDCDDDGSGSGSEGAVDDGGDDGADDGGATMAGIPCDVRAVLETHCASCHDEPPVYGAPMPLLSADHFAAAATSDPDRAVHELVGERVRDEDRPMPPSGELSEAERDALLSWVDAGAPVDAEAACEAGGEPPPAVGPDELPCEPTYTFTAHAPGSTTEGFSVPEVGAENLYACFAFKSPLAVPTQATAWAPIIDDERVLHHWILYRTPTPQEEGAVGPCEMPSDAVFVSGWAPGGSNFVLPDDVGLELGGPDDWYILQIHYHNAAHHPDSVDASGVALCTVEEPREKTAGVITLGDISLAIPPNVSDHEEIGTCPSWVTSYLPEPLHVIASFPHMHQLGRGFRTEILRGGSASDIDVLVDVPSFNFENQAFYPHTPAVQVNAGDELRTTCTFDNPGSNWVFTGEATEDEMCFNFVMAYPIEALGTNRACL
jgi:hypothetical protein